MKLLKSKNGKLSTGMINDVILSIVILVVLFKLYATLIPEAQTAGTGLTNAGTCASAGGYWNTTSEGCAVSSTNTTALDYNAIPLGSLFSSSGAVFIIIMVALVIVVIRAFLPSGKK